MSFEKDAREAAEKSFTAWVNAEDRYHESIQTAWPEAFTDGVKWACEELRLAAFNKSARWLLERAGLREKE